MSLSDSPYTRLTQARANLVALPAEMEIHSKRWRDWHESEAPEAEPLPNEWKRLPHFETLLVLRAMRPDRLTLALDAWVRTTDTPTYLPTYLLLARRASSQLD